MSKIVELYGISTQTTADVVWPDIVAQQECPYLARKCLKIRKSAPEHSIGTCSVRYGQRVPKDMVICPYRLLERHQLFMDAIHLLTLHEPGNELHIVSEVPVPGGAVDHFLVSAYQG